MDRVVSELAGTDNGHLEEFVVACSDTSLPALPDLSATSGNYETSSQLLRDGCKRKEGQDGKTYLSLAQRQREG